MTTANQKAINAACNWAINIANNNDFHYGLTKWAHHNGCYFCGTNGKNSAKHKAGGSLSAILKTYCCNPFVTAAFHHGAGAPSIDCKVSSKRINLANDKNKPLQNTKEWKKVSKPDKAEDLKKGDVLLTPTHCMLSLGDGKIVHAKHHDNGVKGSYWNESICVETIPANQFKRITKIYRYIGNGKFKDDPKPKFEIGKTYTLKEDMTLRTGAGTDHEKVAKKNMTDSAKKHLTKDGLLAKGTRVTVKAVKVLSNGAIWIKIPSGWLCAIGSTGKIFVG